MCWTSNAMWNADCRWKDREQKVDLDCEQDQLVNVVRNGEWEDHSSDPSSHPHVCGQFVHELVALCFAKQIEQWADTIYEWVSSYGLEDSVMTVDELSHGDDTSGTGATVMPSGPQMG